MTNTSESISDIIFLEIHQMEDTSGNTSDKTNKLCKYIRMMNKYSEIHQIKEINSGNTSE